MNFDISLYLVNVAALATVLAPIEILIFLMIRNVVKAIPIIVSNIVTELPRLLVEGISGLFQKEKMTALGAAGNMAKAEKAAGLQMIADVDPLKAAILPYLEGQIPKMYRPILYKVLENTPVNFTGYAINVLSSKFPQIAESLKALGVVSNAQQVT